jgi:hypothetical protein
MSLPKLNKHKMNSGCFFEQNGKVWWKEFKKTFGDEYELIDPENLEGFSRQCRFKVLFVRDFTDTTDYRGYKKAFFAVDYNVHLAENVSDNIYIRFEQNSKKYFVSDLTKLGQTCEIGLSTENNQSELIIEHGEPYMVDQKTAKEIMKESGFCYGKCEVKPNGFEFYTTA